MEPTNKSRQIIYIVFAIVVVVIVFIFRGSIFKPKTAPITVENTKATLLVQSKVTIPAVKSELAEAVLNEDMKVLIPTSAKDVTSTSVVYENNKKGYKISFSSPDPILKYPSTYATDLMTLHKWEIISSSTANLFAFLEIKNNKYTVRVNETYDNNKSQVTMDVIQN